MSRPLSAVLRGPAAVAVLLLAATSAEAQQWRSVSSSRQLAGEAKLDVQVRYAAGHLDVGAGSATRLYEMELRYDEDRFRPLTEYQRDSGVLRLGVQSRDEGGTRINRVSDESRARLRLNPRVPTRLRLEFAAGEAKVELGGLALQDVHLSTGASQTRVSVDTPNLARAERVKIEAGAADLQVTGLGNARAERIEVSGGVGNTVLDFGGRWQHDARVSVDMGVGAITLRVPRSLGVRVEMSSFLTRFERSGMERRGGAHYSSNWESAAHRLSFNVSAAMGAVNLVWID
jgi:hypothetical protein